MFCYHVQLSDSMTLNPPVWKPEVFSSTYSDTSVRAVVCNKYNLRPGNLLLSKPLNNLGT